MDTNALPAIIQIQTKCGATYTIFHRILIKMEKSLEKWALHASKHTRVRDCCLARDRWCGCFGSDSCCGRFTSMAVLLVIRSSDPACVAVLTKCSVAVLVVILPVWPFWPKAVWRFGSDPPFVAVLTKCSVAVLVLILPMWPFWPNAVWLWLWPFW